MISPELIRHSPFFGQLDDKQLKVVAMIADEETFVPGTKLFEEGSPAEVLYYLVEGCVDLYFAVEGASKERFPKGIPVGEINPGEPFSISAIIEPHVLTSTAYVSKPSRVIRIKALELRALFKKDKHLAHLLLSFAAKAVIERLFATRVQLAVAWV